MSSRPRILYLSNSYPLTVSGVATVVGNLLEWMSDKYEVGVVCPNKNAKYSKRVLGGVTHYSLPSYPTLIRKDVRFITPNPLQIQKVYDDFEPDIIHLHDPSPASIILRDIAAKNGVPIIFSHHFTPQMVLGYLPETVKSLAQNSDGLNKAILQLTCRIYEKATTIIVPTQTIKRSLSECTDLPISVISSGIKNDAFRSVNQDKQKKISAKYKLPNNPFALYIGRIDPEKNLHVLLEAWSHVFHKNQDYRLVIAGDGGSYNKLREMASELHIERSITWTGLVPASDLPYIYTHPRARVFVIPSPIESQSIVTLMALAAGLPVVAADAGALPELVMNDKTGYLCDSEDAAAFAEKIDYLLQHPQVGQKMGTNGQKVADKHDTSRVVAKYVDLYKRLLSPAR